MDWNQVLQRTDIVGGELETQEDDDVYRGPITKVEIKDGQVVFTMAWVAKMGSKGRWQKWHITTCGVNAIVPPTDIGEGRLSFNVPGLFAVIYPKGGSKLDPAKVDGLQVA